MRRLVMETKQREKPTDPESTYKLFETDGPSKEIFVDGVQGAAFVGAVMKLNFFSRGTAGPVAPGGVEERDLVCRLVMANDTFSSLVKLLVRIEDDVKKQMAAANQAGKVKS